MLLREIGRWPAKIARAEAAFGANRLPDLRLGFHLKIRKAAVLRFLRPLGDTLQFADLRGSEQSGCLVDGLLQAALTELIVAALEHAKTEFHRQDGLQHRQVLLRELLLQVDRVRRDDGFSGVT